MYALFAVDAFLILFTSVSLEVDAFLAPLCLKGQAWLGVPAPADPPPSFCSALTACVAFGVHLQRTRERSH